MFVQIIEARVKDPEGLRRQWQAWDDECRPGATGFLGSTGGITDDGRFIAVARFESEDAARTNSQRGEQTTWWDQTKSFLDGEPSFTDTTETDEFLAGGSNEAGFVQIMRGRADRNELRDVMQEAEASLRQDRPEVIGGLIAWNGDRFVQTVYFTSEAEAREGEKKPAPSRDRLQAATSDLEFVDLRDPWIR